ncbi:MAG TPA: hypothetical protein VK926_07105 [Gaiellaceae bacterium]|nr:hypothetical protein [Gaiellaceae bacterium]
MGPADQSGLDRLDPRDREYVEGLDDAGKRATVVSTILRYQRVDRLQVGDPLPPLELHRLEDGDAVQLDELTETQPLVLVFGSFT